MMFGVKMSCHVIQFPSGRFGYVGSIPTNLGKEVPATTNDILGCRTHKNKQGESVVWKFPVFDSAEQALDYAESRGVAALWQNKARGES